MQIHFPPQPPLAFLFGNTPAYRPVLDERRDGANRPQPDNSDSLTLSEAGMKRLEQIGSDSVVGSVQHQFVQAAIKAASTSDPLSEMREMAVAGALQALQHGITGPIGPALGAYGRSVLDANWCGSTGFLSASGQEQADFARSLLQEVALQPDHPCAVDLSLQLLAPRPDGESVKTPAGLEAVAELGLLYASNSHRISLPAETQKAAFGLETTRALSDHPSRAVAHDRLCILATTAGDNAKDAVERDLRAKLLAVMEQTPQGARFAGRFKDDYYS